MFVKKIKINHFKCSLNEIIHTIKYQAIIKKNGLGLCLLTQINVHSTLVGSVRGSMLLLYTHSVLSYSCHTIKYTH